MDGLNEIKLDDRYTLTYSCVDEWNKWDILRCDGTSVNKNNLPAYVPALVQYIIKELH